MTYGAVKVWFVAVGAWNQGLKGSWGEEQGKERSRRGIKEAGRGAGGGLDTARHPLPHYIDTPSEISPIFKRGKK